jgi:hypothetical protein
MSAGHGSRAFKIFAYVFFTGAKKTGGEIIHRPAGEFNLPVLSRMVPPEEHRRAGRIAGDGGRAAGRRTVVAGP